MKIKKYRPINTVNPIRPNSSAITANIKSVSVSGKKFKWDCVPSPKPLPKIPPDPIAIFDCVIFQADPKGSRSGLNNVAILCLWKGSKKLFHKNGRDIIKTANAEPINVQLRPAKNNIYKPESNITIAVPKSGCDATVKKTIKIKKIVKNVFLRLIGKETLYK